MNLFPPQPFTPSRYQQDFFDALLQDTFDIQLVAVAGSGKTKSIEEAVKRLPLYLQQRTLLSAFNRHIAKEMTDRQKRGDIPQGVTVSTIHGIGYRILNRALRPADRDAWVDDRKYTRLNEIYWSQQNLPQEVTQEPEYKEAVEATGKLSRLTMLTLTDPDNEAALLSLALHFGIEIPENWEGAIQRAIPYILKWGREGLAFKDRDGFTWHPAERISYDDMVYLPTALHLPTPTYEIGFIDECQDFNRAQLELMLRVCPNRRIFVGDPRQAIYGFAGADARSFENIQERTGAKRLPLSISYRCAKSIVERAQWIVPEIEASPTAKQGTVIDIEADKLIELVVNHYNNLATRREPFLLICRVNAPLIGTAFDLIRRGVPAKVKGRDIGGQLLKSLDEIEKVGADDNGGKKKKTRADMGLDRDAQPKFDFGGFPEAAEHYRTVKLSVLRRREGTEMQQASVNDRVDSILCVYEAVKLKGAGSIADMRAHINDLFSDADQAITLSSIHKAKGLEARKVGILQSHLMPHPMAKQPWEMEQESNLEYVAVTRAMEELYIA